MRIQWPDLDADEVHARVSAMWLEVAGFPIPGFAIACPVCGSADVGLKDWRFFERRGATVPWRCDVSAKCCTCSHVLVFGVAVTDELYRSHDRRTYHWRHVREQIEASGGPAGAAPAAR